MTREEWSIVKQVFEASRLLTARDRELYCSAACHSRAVRVEVESLLAVYASDTEFMEEPALATCVANLLDTTPAQVGCYTITGCIGQGGMSTVYEANRSDGQFRQRVAIKILKRGMDTAALLLRFRTERQILAGFQHPHIAQLLDGGTLPDGRPFLVMELIAGEPITEFCDRRKLSITRRLHLFLQVCSAVHAAHQNLIVHRDIKPSNILVTSEGECKLLDFGIAKILEPEQFERTQAPTVAEERLLTPDYASPEQVRGETITTASDIYSLGVLLYEMLAGQPPFRFASRQLDAIARAIETQEVTRPSVVISGACRDPGALASARSTTPVRLRRALEGDLDTIILQALRTEPDRRYRSVEQFADDVRRHQQGLPVTARKETLSYLASKFLARNWAVSLAAALLLFAILVGTAAAQWQARRAEMERQRAERRFAEVRRVADSLIFELHAAIAPLRGSREARELILRRATEMLDGLAKDGDIDASLDLELAAGYRRLGDVQGNPLAENRGDGLAALRSYHEAIRLGKAALAKEPDSRAVKMDLALSYQNLSSIAGPAEAESTISTAIQLHQEMLGSAPLDEDLRGSLGVDYQRRGAVRSDKRNDFSGALRDELRSRDLLQEVAASPKCTSRTLAQLSYAHKRIGSLLMYENRLDAAFQEFQAGLALDERLTAEHPNDGSFEFNKTFAYTDLGEYYRIRGDFRKAIEYDRKALTIRESQAATDPSSVRTRQGVADSLSYLALDLTGVGDLAGVLNARLRAIQILHDLAAARPDNVAFRVSLSKEEGQAVSVLEEIVGPLQGGCRAILSTTRSRFQRANGALQLLKPEHDVQVRLSSLWRRLAQCDLRQP